MFNSVARFSRLTTIHDTFNYVGASITSGEKTVSESEKTVSESEKT